jgi:hypothetical protein
MFLKKKINNKLNRGYTLVELIIAIQIFFMILTFAYTIYLFGHKFLLSWEEKNDIINDELQIKRVLLNELSKAKEIITISTSGIEYINPKYSCNKIDWLENNICLNQRRINHSKIAVILDQFNIVLNNNNKLEIIPFSRLDINHDKILNKDEFSNIEALQIEFELKSKRFTRKNQLLIALTK